MKKKLLSILLSVLLAIAALPVYGAGAASAACVEYSGSNRDAQNYGTWADTVNSYLTVCEDGSLMRFQYADRNDGYLAEYYDASYQLLRAEAIAAELPLFGGFYASENYYFILTGQENRKESASVECYRITKYDKDWKRLGSVGLYDCNTTVPFRAGSARMTEYGNFLLIRTCHEMYASSRDGKNHQANVTIQVDMDAMKITDSFTDVMNAARGYVSHSFNQFIRTEDGKIAAVDHGDAYPRSVVLIRYNTEVSGGTFIDARCNVTNLLNIPGKIGDNYTGVSVGGFELSSAAYIVAGNKVDFDSDDRNTRNIFVAAMDRTTGEVTVNTITDYGKDDGKASTPHLVKLSEDEFVLLWSLKEQVYYTWLDGNGRQTGKVYELEGSLSDCVPLVYGGKLVWYTWKDSAVTFYEIDTAKPAETRQVEVQSGHEWKCRSIKNHTAVLQCAKCGAKKTVDTPADVQIWWQEQENTDGYYRSAFSNPFEVGEEILYWIEPESKKTSAAGEECRDFVLEYSDPEAAEFLPDEFGDGRMGTMRFRKPGQYTLVIRHIYDDSLKREYTFVVNGEPDAVSLKPKSLTLNPGKTRTLTPSLTPEGATTTYTWKSSNTKVATVKNGKVTTVGVGTAKITVKTANGKTATCTVTVKNLPEGVKLCKTSLTLKAGETFTLKATLTPSDAYTTYTWTSSNTKIATVKNGKVTAVGKGTAKITVKTANGKTATCKVVVK